MRPLKQTLWDFNKLCDSDSTTKDNPYTTADKWLLQENLPLSYRQQIAEFILQNSRQRDTAFDSSFRDPFTGSSAYILGEHSNKYAISAKPTYKHIPKESFERAKKWVLELQRQVMT